MKIESYFYSSTSRNETILYIAVLESNLALVQKIAKKLLNHPDREASLEFLGQQSLGGRTAFDLLPGSCTGETKAIVDCLSALRTQLRQPVRSPSPPPVETPLIFSLLQRRQYDSIGVSACVSNPNQLFNKQTPLAYCIEKEDLEGVKALLQISSIDVNKEDGFGVRPLEAALRKVFFECVELLLARGASLI